MTPNADKRERFLTAEWRHLLMLNFPVEREVLEPLVPAGTTLDTYKGMAYVSMVGFLFLKTRLLGVPVPFHQDFEGVNLRFYVRRFSGDDWRRGVVFVKEIVPKPAIALVARVVYNENYVALRMSHTLERQPDGSVARAEFSWELDGRPNRLAGNIAGREGGGVDPQVDFGGHKVFAGRVDTRIKYLECTFHIRDHQVAHFKGNFTVCLVNRPFVRIFHCFVLYNS